MRLATFTDRAGTRVGRIEGEAVVDLAAAAPALPHDMAGLLGAGADALAAAGAAGPSIPLAEVRLEAPIARPGKFLAIGLNFIAHIEELGAARPSHPSCFLKLGTAINGPYDPVWRPRTSDSLDYEGELGVVIGRRCRQVPAAHAHEVIAGYVVVNDFTVREWVRWSPQVSLAKSFDTACPYGPWITTADEVGDPQTLRIRTWVNGELRQDGVTADMLFPVYDLVAHVSRGATLEPGDVITTGTPPGVGEGHSPPRYLQPGDVVRVEIDRLGALENGIVEEPAGSAFR